MNGLEDNVLLKLLSSFSCTPDKDIEFFLHHRATEFETLSKARTYVVFNADDFESGNKYPVVYGYISLGLRRKLDGFNAKIDGQQISDFPCYLIGQLSKNCGLEDNPLSGNILLKIAFDIIASAAEAVGGRYMMIECRNEAKLLKFYGDNSFSEIDHIPDDDVPMVQMIRKI